MSRDSRPSDQLAEELRDLDAGLQLDRPKVEWAKAVSARHARRQTTRAAAGSLIVLGIILHVAWYANRPSTARKDAPLVVERANPKADSRAELLAFDRELSQISRSIVSMKRSQRKALADKIVKRSKPIVTDSVDPIEEGALVFLAAAEKAERSNGKDASLALYRRLVELFPETRSAEIARRQLM